MSLPTAPPLPPVPLARRLAHGLAVALLALASAYFVYQLWTNLHHLPDVDWSGATLAVLLASVLGTLLTVALIALMWQCLLRDQGVHLGYRQALRIVAISQFGKYLPGNIGHYTGRALLAAKEGVPTGKTVATMAVEVVWTLAISSAFTVVALLVYVDDLHEGLVDNAHPGYMALLGGLMLFAPFVGVRLLNAMAPGLSRKLGKGDLVAAPRLGTALLVSALMMLCFAVLGSVLWLQASVVFGHPEVDWLQLTLLFTLAWTAGYIVPGAPGGLGVREAVMLKLLAPQLGISVVLGLSLVMRLSSMGGDALAFALGWLDQRAQRTP